MVTRMAIWTGRMDLHKDIGMEVSASSSSSSSSSSSKPSWNYELHDYVDAGLSSSVPEVQKARSESTSSACSTASTSAESPNPQSPFSEAPEECCEEPKGSILYRPMGSSWAAPTFDEKVVDTDILCIWEPASSCSVMDLLSEQASSLRLHDSHEAHSSTFDFRSVARAKSEPSFRHRRPPPLDEHFFLPSRPRLHDRQQKNDNSRRRSSSRSRSRSRSR